MRRRTKPRVVWLPPTNNNSIDTVTLTSGIQVFVVSALPDPGVATGEISVVIDGSKQDPLDVETSLSDIENSGYRLRRIVGKIWCRMAQVDDSSIPFVVVTAGLIIRRTSEPSGVSTAVSTGNQQLIEASQIRNYGDPWIWRRSWLLGNNVSPGFPATFPQFAETNEFFSALDGPHVDQKTARIVGPEERLFLDVTVRTNKTGAADPDQIPAEVLVLTDLRVLASMRTSTGNRRNATR